MMKSFTDMTITKLNKRSFLESSCSILVSLHLFKKCILTVDSRLHTQIYWNRIWPFYCCTRICPYIIGPEYGPILFGQNMVQSRTTNPVRKFAMKILVFTFDHPWPFVDLSSIIGCKTGAKILGSSENYLHTWLGFLLSLRRKKWIIFNISTIQCVLSIQHKLLLNMYNLAFLWYHINKCK